MEDSTNKRSVQRKTCVLCSSLTYCGGVGDQVENLGLSHIYKLIENSKCVSSNHQKDCSSALVEREGEVATAFAKVENGCSSLLEDMLKNLEQENYSVCANCNETTAKALESKFRAEKVEVEVRLLQRQLLDLLRKLQQEMEVFSQEMGKIERFIKKPANDDVIDASQLELDEQPGKEKYVAMGTAVFVRERILEVVTDLRFFQSELNDKLVESRKEATFEAELKCTTFEIPEPEVHFIPETEEEVEVITCDASLMEEEPVVDESINLHLEYSGYLGHYILGGAEAETGDADIDNINNSTHNNNDVSSSEEPLFPNQTAPEAESTSTYFNKKQRPSKKTKTTKFKGVNLSRMSSFKRCLIKRAMEREMKRKLEDDHHENPLIKYYLRYDPHSDSFFVGNVQVRLRNGRKDAETKLECTGFDCDAFWLPPTNNEHTSTFDRDIRNHVIGKHLGGFSCRVCNLVLNSYFKLMTHFKKYHPGQKPLNDQGHAIVNHRQRTNKVISNGYPKAGSSRHKGLDRFRKKTPKRLAKAQRLLIDEELQVPSSPSEGLKQVRLTMKNAIESLGDNGSNQSHTRSPVQQSTPSTFPHHNNHFLKLPSTSAKTRASYKPIRDSVLN